jgi:hypothetical protein
MKIALLVNKLLTFITHYKVMIHLTAFAAYLFTLQRAFVMGSIPYGVASMGVLIIYGISMLVWERHLF